jgi:hypothetical protein
LITHRTIAAALDVDTATILKWSRDGDFPEPHSSQRSDRGKDLPLFARGMGMMP